MRPPWLWDHYMNQVEILRWQIARVKLDIKFLPPECRQTKTKDLAKLEKKYELILLKLKRERYRNLVGLARDAKQGKDLFWKIVTVAIGHKWTIAWFERRVHELGEEIERLEGKSRRKTKGKEEKT